jgi:hypothetical protein
MIGIGATDALWHEANDMAWDLWVIAMWTGLGGW